MERPVLVYMPDRGVGDLMWHLPTIRAIAAAAPEGRVILATRPTTRAAAVLAVEPAIERVCYLEYRTGALKQLRETLDFHRLCRSLRPRSVWILEKIGRPAQAAWLAGVPERHGFGLGHAGQERYLTGPTLPKSMRPAHRIEKLAAFEALHGLGVTCREPALRVDPSKAEVVRARFADRPQPWIVLGPGAVDEARRWPLENFTRLSDELSKAGTVFWLGGGAEEKARFFSAIQGLQRSDTCVLSCDLPLDEAAALISLSALFVGNDSGLMNLAAAVGVPTIGLYGPSEPLTYSKWLSGVVSPTDSMADIAVDAALAEVRRRSAPARTARSNAPN